MTDSTEPAGTEPPGSQPDSTAPDSTEPDSTSGTKDPTGVEGANPALDDTGDAKAAEVGEAPKPPENLEDLDLTPEGLADEPAKQEDAASQAKPENS